MAVIVGAFLGGPDTTLEAGTASISLSINTVDRNNIDTAVWTISAPGFSRTVQADASGRGYIVVPAGKTYTVTMEHGGFYLNDGPQTVLTESKMNYGVLFDLFSYPPTGTKLSIVVRFGSNPAPGVTVLAEKDGLEVTETTGLDGVAVIRGLDVGLWNISLPEYEKTTQVEIDQLIESVEFAIGGISVNIQNGDTLVRVSGPVSLEKESVGGKAEFGPLKAGSYTVSLPDFAISQAVQVGSDISNVSVSLGGISVSVKNGDATIRISGPQTSEKMSSGGQVLFAPLKPGRYTVTSPTGSKVVDVSYSIIQLIMYSRFTIYGIRIDQNVSDPYDRVAYTDDAVGMTPASGENLNSWANTDLFKNIKPVVRYPDGTFKDLNKRDTTRCIDGSGSSIEQLGNDAFTEFPTWYVSESRSGNVVTIKISDGKVDESYHAMHAMDNGVQRSCFHIGHFHAYASSELCYSSNSRTPSVNISTQNFARYCQARGSGFDQFSWYAWNYVAILFLLAYKSTHSQSAFARGYVNGSSVRSEAINSFNNDFGLSGSSDGNQQMSFLWINDLWGNVYTFIGGAKTNGQNQLMTILNGNNCTVNDSDFTVVGSGGQTSGFGGYISEMDLSDSKVGFFPKATRGSSSSHWCDYGYVDPSRFPRVGGYYSDGDAAGLFRVDFGNSASNTSSTIGSRLMYKGGR